LQLISVILSFHHFNHYYLDYYLVHYLVNYYQDFIKPNKKYRNPTDRENAAMQDLAKRLREYKTDDAEPLQNIVFAAGNDHGFENLREWFQALYEVLLGQSQGPRFGSFIELYGTHETAQLIDRALKGENLAA
jgi:lysyl-tRNA synthetase class 1